MPIFNHLRVIELGSGGALAYCGKLFSDYGAEVIKIEPHGGDDIRRAYPVLDVGNGHRESGFGAWLNTGKRSVTADWQRQDSEKIAALIAASDVLIDSRPVKDVEAGLLSHSSLAKFYPGLIITHVTSFGRGGAYQEFVASEVVLRALSGLVEGIGPVDGPPMLVEDGQTGVIGGLAAFIPTAAAVFDRQAGGRSIELSLQDALAHAIELDISYAVRGTARPRSGVNRFGRHYPASIYATADGWLGVSTVTPAQWRGMCDIFGLAHIAADPRFATSAVRILHSGQLDALFEPVIQQKTSEEWFAICLEKKLPCVVVPTMAQLLAQKVHRRRGAFVSVMIGEAQFEAPILPARLGGDMEPPRDSRAPLAGEDNAILEALPSPRSAGRRAEAKRMPLAGVRVLDLTMGWAGPFATRHLGDLGAEVVKVEGCAYPDWWRGTTFDAPFYRERLYEKNNAFNMMNRNKKGVTLDLTDLEGREILMDLVRHSDVFIENYSSEVLPKLGLSHEKLRAANPKLIIVPMPAFGLNNEWSHTRAYGGTLEQATGLPTVTGQPDWPPAMSTYAYGDPIGGYNAAASVLLALLARQVSGEGMVVDFSQIEGMLTLTAPAIIEQSATGATSERIGNRHRRFAPQGAYPAAGENAWIVLTVRSDEEWARLAPSLGLDDDMLSTVEARRVEHDRIDKAIAKWTKAAPADTRMTELQAMGIAGGVARSTTQILTDPNMHGRGSWMTMTREYSGDVTLQRSAYTIDGARCPVDRNSPTLGEHNREILGGLLGLSAARLDSLEARGIIGSEALPKRATT